MEEEQFIWEHFKLNAEQRLKGFNFFVLLSIFADGGVFTAIEKNLNPYLLFILGIFIIALAIVFLLVDTRSRRLIKLTIPALKKLESKFSVESQLFTNDEIAQGKLVRYTTALRILFVTQMLFGIGVLVFAALKIIC
jgi:hypothetical protein